MKEILKISQQFWHLFYSKNRYIYMEALMAIYDEYLYNDYFLTRETCIQLIAERFSDRIIDITADDEEQEADNLEPMSAKILNRLLRFAWLKKIEDYSSFKTNIVIPDYASAFIEVFRRLSNPDSEETDIYIQNIYTNIYSFYYDNKAGIELLKTARINTNRLNRALQDMLHNMDGFFESLLQKNNYEELLQEHLDVYVEAIVNKKYSLLKTSDNFYIYKNDIKRLLRSIQEDEGRLYALKHRMMAEGIKEEEIESEFMDIIYEIERGIINMENRISHIDTEHSRYVRATVSRLEYLLSNDDSMRGNVIALLNLMSGDKNNELLNKAAASVRINDHTIISPDSLYKKRGKHKVFEETVEAEEKTEGELSKEEILRINRNKNRYSKTQIEQFILGRMTDGVYSSKEQPVKNDEEFELLILAYDYSIRKSSPFRTVPGAKGNIANGRYTYPDIVFEKNYNAGSD
ncbi:hypothetical protein LY28_00065 [Ruminiclostridium sufflavum DSM 19573]|uniref:TIGR02677 family protein n=1 Tax=Ruminiclostridium sufflavum DSM 19573 TaxID=1121337 RepID=A0A318XQ37_9FIRM|nr:Wadjet anti-phage system protein JetA family protein [Ruminiclostridium sufflavum]PYG90185.1 hypothetical protein LY28_00065 [Ruminiclostridium sufflavum DSM 19573]